MMTRLAPTRLMPRPPARVDIRKRRALEYQTSIAVRCFKMLAEIQYVCSVFFLFSHVLSWGSDVGVCVCVCLSWRGV